MAMELYILSERMLGSIEEWQRSIDEGGFLLNLSTGVTFTHVSGFIPATLNGEDTGFECVHWPVSNLSADLDIPSHWKYVLALRMIGKISEVAAAYMAASAYARATDGAVYDCEEGKFITAQRAAEIAREIEVVGPRIQEAADRAVQAALRK